MDPYRGSGPWLSRRAGNKNRLESSVYGSRGAGWRDTAKSLFKNVLALFRNTVVPQIRKHGPSLAEQAAKYALNAASAYARDAKVAQPVQRIVDKAVNDLPEFVGDTLRRIAVTEGRGGSPETEAEIQAATAATRDLLPALQSAATSRVTQRLQSLHNISENQDFGGVGAQLARIQQEMSHIFSDDSDMEDEMRFMISLIHAMIQSVLIYMHNAGLIASMPTLQRLALGARNAVQQLSYSGNPMLRSRLALTEGPNDEDDDTARSIKTAIPAPINLSPTVRQRERAKRTMSRLNHLTSFTVKTKPIHATVTQLNPLPAKKSTPRGGIVGAAVLIPALAALLPGVAGAISDIVHTWTRGSGVISPKTEDQFMDALNATVAQHNCRLDRPQISAILREAENSDPSEYANYIISRLVGTQKRSRGYSKPSKRMRR